MHNPNHLINGPSNALATVILAHGAGAPMDSIFMQTFAEGIARHSLRCVRFEFPYMAKRRATGIKKPPNRMPVLIESFSAVIGDYAGTPLIIGGKSMGGRAASMVAAKQKISESCLKGLVCLGYPFHPPGKPENLRLDHFSNLKTHTLILQGTRDPFGTQDEILNYSLPTNVILHWLEDGEHSFKPRAKSGRTLEDNWQEGIDTLCTFVKQIVS